MTLQDKGFIQYNFENSQQFRQLLKSAGSQVSDLRFPMGEIARDFYKSERAIFLLKGPGEYTDLNPKYAEAKQKAVGFKYPILKSSGKLEKSITTPNAPGSILKIDKKSVQIGTSDPKAIFHNSDAPRNKLPQRKFVFIGPEVKAFHAKDRANKGGRLTRWTNIVEKYVETVLKQKGFE